MFISFTLSHIADGIKEKLIPCTWSNSNDSSSHWFPIIVTQHTLHF